jgi:hypothetical protein
MAASWPSVCASTSTLDGPDVVRHRLGAIPAASFKVDVFVSKDRPFDRMALKRSRPEALSVAPGTRHFPISSAEDTVIAKLEWFRAGGETSDRQ